MKCPNCGADVTTRFCTYCGSEMPKNLSGLNLTGNSGNVFSDSGNTNISGSQNSVSNQTIIHNTYYVNSNNDMNRSYRPAQEVRRTRIEVELVSPKSKTTALILCVVLGIVGGHHFYAGRYGMGVLYLFTYGLFGIGWVIDIIQIATGKYKDSRGLPIRN